MKTVFIFLIHGKEYKHGNHTIQEIRTIIRGYDMTDRTIGIIKAIKQSGKVWNRAVAEYMSERTGTPIEDYTEHYLNMILKEAFIDYIATCDNPAFEVETLINLMTSCGASSLGCHLANILGMTQVRDAHGYVNGFRELSDCKKE